MLSSSPIPPNRGSQNPTSTVSCESLRDSIQAEFALDERTQSGSPCSLLVARRWRGRLLRCTGDRKTPATANSHEPQPEAHDRASDRHRGHRQPQRGPDYHHSGAGQDGDSIKIGALYGWNFGQEHVRGHATADPRQHAESRCHDGVQPKGKRLLRAGYRKKASMRERLYTEIALEALNLAIERQRPPPGLIHHSDRGVQYAPRHIGWRWPDTGSLPR